MNKKAKTLLKFGAICFGVLMFSTSCSANFCTVNDQAHILYKYDSGLSYTEEGNVQYTEDGKLMFTNSAITSMVSELGGQYGVPSYVFFKALDDKTYSAALDLATSEGHSDYTKEEVLYHYGYVRYAGVTTNKKGKEVDTLFANFDAWVAEINATLPASDVANKDFISAYKSKLNSYVSGIRTCITPTDGYFGKDEDLFIEGKTWGDAWKHGLIEGLIIYPVAWFADILANSMSSIGAGAAALLSILIVTIIVRVLMTLATFKSTMSQQKISALQPELAKIQAKYPNSNTNPYDKQRMAQEQMNLYKKYKINPFSSILVLIIQFPIFIGIWGALSGASVLSTGSVLGVYLSESISSVILTWSFNGAWWTALVLFLLMSGVQIVASKLPQWLQKKELKKVAKMGTNPAADQQQKTMKWMQIIMMVMIIVMGFTLPSGMGVYWLVGGLVSMLQTVITQSIMRKKKVK